MKILITGGEGFIGHHLVGRLHENHQITVIDNNNTKPAEKKYSDVKYCFGDIREKETLNAVCYDQDIVFHLAALANIKKSKEDPDYCISTNIGGLLNLLEAVKENKIKKVIFTSSREVYGNQTIFPVKENSSLNPVNLYGNTKKIGEDLLKAYSEAYGFDFTILRLSNVYGKEDSVGGRVIPTFLKNAKSNSPIQINGGDQILDFVYVDNVVKMLEISIDNFSKKIYNVGTGKGTTIKELANLILKETQSKSKLEYLPSCTQEVDNYIASISNMPFKPKTLEEGIKNLL